MLMPVAMAMVAVMGLSPTVDASTTALLRAKDQALLDGITNGDERLWSDTLAPGAIILDENGVAMTREVYLATIKPLPPGIGGHIDIADYRMTRSGDLAAVIHRDNETEFYHGVTLRQRFWNSEAWKLTPGGWKLILFHESMVLEEPPAITLSPDVLASYVGRYTAGAELAYVIGLDHGSLVGGREGRPPTPLLAEARDVLFVKGEPRNRKVFLHDASGAVTGFVDRREGNDLPWKRADAPRS